MTDPETDTVTALDVVDANIIKKITSSFGGKKSEITADFDPRRIEKRTVESTETLVEDCYPIDSFCHRGICLILSNDEFHPSLCLEPRKGSSVDEEAAAECFRQLGFDVKVERNKTEKETLW